MKILKIVLGVIAFLIVAFLAIGFIVPQFEYGNSVIIQASQAKCWDVYTDTTLRKRWIEGEESYRLVEGKPLAVGAKYESVIVEDERMVMTEEILSINPSQEIETLLMNDVLKLESKTSFEGDSAQTTITTHYKMKGNNVFMRSMLLLMKSRISGEDEKMLTSFKTLVESN